MTSDTLLMILVALTTNPDGTRRFLDDAANTDND
jgi:hypothetical protein